MTDKPSVKISLNKPKRPMSSYMLWLNSAREQIKTNNPGLKHTELAKKGGELWRTLKDKREWHEKAAQLREQYAKDLKSYNINGGGGGEKEEEVEMTDKLKRTTTSYIKSEGEEEAAQVDELESYNANGGGGKREEEVEMTDKLKRTTTSYIKSEGEEEAAQVDELESYNANGGGGKRDANGNKSKVVSLGEHSTGLSTCDCLYNVKAEVFRYLIKNVPKENLESFWKEVLDTIKKHSK